MNIRYPIYEGVYRILTIEQGELTQKEFLDGVLETVNEVTGEIFLKLSEDGQPHGSI